MKKAGRSVVFTRFFLSYLAILMIPFLIFSIWTGVVMQERKKNSIRESVYVLDSLRDEVDYKMESVYSDIVTLNYNVTINNLIHSPSQQKDIGQLLNSKDEIARIQRESTVLYVYLPDENILLSNKGVYSELEKLYGKVFSYGEMDYREFYDKILNQEQPRAVFPNARVKVDSREFSSVLYLQRIPFGSQKGKGAQILVFIDDSFIKKQTEGYVDQVGRWFGIYTKDKELIYKSSNYPEKQDGLIKENLFENDSRQEEKAKDIGESVYTWSRSNYNGWMFVSGISKKDLYSWASQMLWSVFFLFLVYAAVGCYASYCIARRNLIPLRRILALWNPEEEKSGRVDEYQLLEYYVQNAITKNQELTESNNGYMKKMKEMDLHGLLCGKYNTQEEIDELDLQEITDFSNFEVLILDFSLTSMVMEEESIDDFNTQRYQIKMLLESMNMEDMIYMEINMYQMGLLFYSNEERSVFEKQMKEKSQMILEYLTSHMGERLRLGKGEAVQGALHIGYSFVQAKCAVRACLEYNKNYMDYGEIPRGNEKYYFPAQLREMVFENLQKGNLKQLKSILKVLHVENFQIRKLSGLQKRQFLEEMYSVMLHMKNKELISEEELAGAEEEKLDGEEKYYYYANRIMNACQKKTEEAFSEKKKLKHDLLRFVDENYMDSNLCLAMAAAYFHMSESYLSCTFKKNYGVNFSSYLENKRIEQAKLLLLEEKYSVEDVGRMVGYNSAHVFRRAFRKVAGYNPSERRQ